MEKDGLTPEQQELFEILSPQDQALARLARAVYDNPSGHRETIRAINALEAAVYRTLGVSDPKIVPSASPKEREMYKIRGRALENAETVWGIDQKIAIASGWSVGGAHRKR